MSSAVFWTVLAVSLWATGASLTGVTVIETVAGAEFSAPSLTRYRKESAPL